MGAYSTAVIVDQAVGLVQVCRAAFVVVELIVNCFLIYLSSVLHTVDCVWTSTCAVAIFSSRSTGHIGIRDIEEVEQ